MFEKPRIPRTRSNNIILLRTQWLQASANDGQPNPCITPPPQRLRDKTFAFRPVLMPQHAGRSIRLQMPRHEINSAESTRMATMTGLSGRLKDAEDAPIVEGDCGR
jgi:hypothetical protein